jgi:rhodanese-related sulfurtransferase
MNKRTIIIMAGVFLLGLALLGIGECSYEKIDSIRTMESAITAVRADFPAVKSVSPKALRLYQTSSVPLLILDVRAKEEFDVSRLSGAVHFEKPKDLIDFLLRQKEKPDTIAVYGSLGFRSAEFIEAASKGAAGLENLEGGIFAWANAGMPLEDSQGDSTTLVHPYNKIWGRLLDKEKRAAIE